MKLPACGIGRPILEAATERTRTGENHKAGSRGRFPEELDSCRADASLGWRRDLLPRNHAIGKLARQMETS
ncbi:hypothetical protein L6Q21_05110, partial [Sandaracinobacter sp. RS1-74]|uniref:hypothetical protein n=1 Tax=Sandaracinobacteroides sayramensis TaxID=2913411 RepID=UPI001EDBBFF0